MLILCFHKTKPPFWGACPSSLAQVLLFAVLLVLWTDFPSKSWQDGIGLKNASKFHWSCVVVTNVGT